MCELMKYWSDAQLADMENALKEGDGYDIPLAWIIGFLQDYDLVLLQQLSHLPTAKRQLEDIMDWIYNGDPERRK